MERTEAQAVYDAGREAVVEVLLAMDRRIVQLEARVESSKRQLAKNSGTLRGHRAQTCRGVSPGAARIAQGAGLAPNQVMRVTGDRCCRHGRLTS